MRRNQKGFTLMELMVVIVIVAILAAVAVPLYINYVKDARRTEAKAAIGALATAMEEYSLKVGEYADDHTKLYPLNPGDARNSNLDVKTVEEIEQHWTIAITNANGAIGYTLTLTGKDKPYEGLGVEYVYERGKGGTLTDKD